MYAMSFRKEADENEKIRFGLCEGWWKGKSCSTKLLQLLSVQQGWPDKFNNFLCSQLAYVISACATFHMHLGELFTVQCEERPNNGNFSKDTDSCTTAVALAVAATSLANPFMDGKVR